MLPESVWLCLTVWCLIPCTPEATVTSTSVCGLVPCNCNRGKLQCDCTTTNIKNLALENEMFDSYSFSSINVANCKHVHVASRALSGLPALQQVTVANVSKLTLDEQAFSWTDAAHTGYSPYGFGVIVNISGSSIPKIPSYCFQGNLKEVMLTNVNVTTVGSYAFSSIINAEKLEFTGVNFDELETQSFKKLRVNFLTFKDTYLALIPKRAIWDVQVEQEVRFVRVTTDKIESKAVNIHESRSFRIMQSHIGHLEGNAFSTTMKGDVSVHDNSFYRTDKHAFVGFTVEPKYIQEAGKQDFIFENNTLVEFQSASLAFTTSSFSPRLDWVILGKPCSCDKTEEWITGLVSFSQDSTAVPDISKIIYCFNPMPRRIEDFKKFKCLTKSSLLLTITAIFGIILVIIMIAVVVFCRYRKRGKRYINVPVSERGLKPATGTAGHMLVVPEGKTYRETELHVIVEHASPIESTEYVSERSEGQ